MFDKRYNVWYNLGFFIDLRNPVSGKIYVLRNMVFDKGPAPFDRAAPFTDRSALINLADFHIAALGLPLMPGEINPKSH